MRRDFRVESGTESLNWLKSPKGVLAFRRGNNFALFANTTDHETLILLKDVMSGQSDGWTVALSSSNGTTLSAGTLKVPPHTTIWLRGTLK
jgi:hypothetical protein